jgi:hypothetical protein
MYIDIYAIFYMFTRRIYIYIYIYIYISYFGQDYMHHEGTIYIYTLSIDYTL